MKNYLRNGDHYFHPLEELPKNLKKIEVKSNKYVFGVGEGSNHFHTLTMPRTQDVEIFKDNKGNVYFDIKTEGRVQHTIGDTDKVADHKEIKIKPGFYIQVPEREVDLFEQVERKVID